MNRCHGRSSVGMYLYLMPGRYWNILIKCLVVIAFAWFITKRFAGGQDLHTVWMAFQGRIGAQPVWMLIAVLALMPCNWLFEVTKWRMLLSPEVLLSWRRAVAGVLSGITFSLFMPNRTGEFGGRILYVPGPYRWAAVLASLTGSFAQNLVYITFGILSALAFFHAAGNIPVFAERGLWVMAGSLLIVFSVLYFHLPSIARMASRWNPPQWIRKPWHALTVLAHTDRKRLSYALAFSVARYGIFTVQYVLLLRYFGADVSWFWLVAGVAVIFLVQTSLPLPPLFDILTRNEVGIFLWAGFGVSEPVIVAAGLSIWIINLAFPALFGLIAISAVNVLRTFGYEPHSSTPVAAQPGRVDLD